MTIKECIDIVDNIKPNQYGTRDKVQWLSFIDEIIINDVLKTHEGYDGRYDNFAGYSEDKLSVPLIVPSPYDRLYTAYLKMKIDGENGETARYNNSAAEFNSYLMEYRKYYNKTHMPLTNADRTKAMPPKKTSVGISDAEFENLKRELYALLSEEFAKMTSPDKIYDIVMNYVNNNVEMLKGRDGIDGINGRDGIDGKDGVNGKDGYTPIKGVDYFDVGAGNIAEDGTSVIYNDIDNNIAGTKAFKIISGDEATKSYVLDSVDGLKDFVRWGEDERYLSFYLTSIDGLASHRSDRTSRIVGVDTSTNTITVDIYYGGWGFEGIGKGSYLRVIAHPELGTFYTEGYAFVGGHNNRSLGIGSFTAGKNNVANGAYSFIGGRNNFVNYCGTAFGRYNLLMAQLCTALGQYSELYGHNSAAIGNKLRTNAPNQLAVGRYNVAEENAMFMVGAGDSEENRINVFSVDESGNAKAKGQVIGEGVNLNVEVEKIKNKPVAEIVKNLPDVGETNKIYCVSNGKTFDEYVFLHKNRSETYKHWDGTIASSYARGTGIKEDPYIIETAEQFALMVDSFGGDGEYFKLANDIYLNDVSIENWETTGDNKPWFEALADGENYKYKTLSGSNTGAFQGNVDGDGYLVYGLWYPDNTAFWGAGLIPTITNSTIKNLGIKNSHIVATANSGAFSASTARGISGEVTFENCFIDSDVIVKSTQRGGAASGFVGYPTVGIKTTIKNCYCLIPDGGCTATESYKANAFVGQTWNSPYRLLNCFSVIRPFNSYNLTARMSSLVDWTYNGVTMDRPVDYDAVYSNIYTIDTSTLNNNEYGYLDSLPLFKQMADENMRGEDVLTNANKMPGLGDAYLATVGYPILKAFVIGWEKIGISNDVLNNILDRLSALEAAIGS